MIRFAGAHSMHGWDENERTLHDLEEDWSTGEHVITFSLEPIVQNNEDELLDDDDDTGVSFEIHSVTIVGPQGTDLRVHPDNYERFFDLDAPPENPEERRRYAADTLRDFATKAFRGPVNEVTVERLVRLAEASYFKPNVTLESGIARAMVAVLASPRFLFRIESAAEAERDVPFALVDELSLASRMSYFFWSSMPDQELFDLAKAGKLREQLPRQVERMLSDRRADAFVSNIGSDSQLRQLRFRLRMRLSIQSRLEFAIHARYLGSGPTRGVRAIVRCRRAFGKKEELRGADGDQQECSRFCAGGRSGRSATARSCRSP